MAPTISCCCCKLRSSLRAAERRLATGRVLATCCLFVCFSLCSLTSEPKRKQRSLACLPEFKLTRRYQIMTLARPVRHTLCKSGRQFGSNSAPHQQVAWDAFQVDRLVALHLAALMLLGNERGGATLEVGLLLSFSRRRHIKKKLK